MKEYEIDEEFVCDGVILKCVKGVNCRECGLYNYHSICGELSCDIESRKDREDVIFIEVPKDTKYSNLLNAMTPILIDEPSKEVEKAIAVLTNYCKLKQGE